MAKEIYLGDPATGLARKIKKLYLGDPTNGLARKVKKMYIGDPVTGLARLCWSAVAPGLFASTKVFSKDGITWITKPTYDVPYANNPTVMVDGVYYRPNEYTGAFYKSNDITNSAWTQISQLSGCNVRFFNFINGQFVVVMRIQGSSQYKNSFRIAASTDCINWVWRGYLAADVLDFYDSVYGATVSYVNGTYYAFLQANPNGYPRCYIYTSTDLSVWTEYTYVGVWLEDVYYNPNTGLFMGAGSNGMTAFNPSTKSAGEHNLGTGYSPSHPVMLPDGRDCYASCNYVYARNKDGTFTQLFYIKQLINGTWYNNNAIMWLGVSPDGMLVTSAVKGYSVSGIYTVYRTVTPGVYTDMVAITELSEIREVQYVTEKKA